jgi:hypothetical protein
MTYPGAGGPGPNPQPAQLFTPGLATENQFQQQQMQSSQTPYYGQTSGPEYINGPQPPMYGQEQYGQSQASVNTLVDQFGQMNMGQKGLRLYTTNLLTSPPEPQELHRPPPEIVLPPNSTFSPSPLANADHTYQRCTLNAIPTTNSLLKKSNIPLGLILTPYRSVKEGDEPVPLVTDTVIARCRRCRTYINPYVQFIDGGNRYASIVCIALVLTSSGWNLAGDAACVLCQTRFPSFSIGTRLGTSRATDGHVQNLTMALSSLSHPQNIWSALRSPLFTSSSSMSAIVRSSPGCWLLRPALSSKIWIAYLMKMAGRRSLSSLLMYRFTSSLCP